MNTIPDNLNDLFEEPMTGSSFNPLTNSATGKRCSRTARIPYRDRTFAKGLSRRHEAVLKWMLEHPAATQKECAKATGYSETWISRIVNNAEFREKFEQVTRPILHDAVRQMLAKKP